MAFAGWRLIVREAVVCVISVLILLLAEVVAGQGGISITDTTDAVNLAQAGLTLLGAVAATIVTLVRGSLGAEVYQKSLLSRTCACIRLRPQSMAPCISPQLQGTGNFANIILCAREAEHCARGAAQHIWSFGGGEALVIVLEPFQCTAAALRGRAVAECFKGACTKWHRDLVMRCAADGSAEAVPGTDESLIVHSGVCRGGLSHSWLLGRNHSGTNFVRLVVCVVAGFPPEKTQESDIAARLTSTLDESHRGASCTAHKIVLGAFRSDKPFWIFSKDWALWSWWMLSLAECLLALALSGVFALDSYNAALGARRIVRSYVTDHTGTADVPTPFAKRVFVEGFRETRHRFFKIEHRSARTTGVCRASKLVVGGLIVPLVCQALWALQAAGEYELLVRHRGERKLWQVWLSSGVVCVVTATGTAVLWRVPGKRTGFGGRYEIQKPLAATAAFVALGLASVGVAAVGGMQLVRTAHALALCGVLQQWSCWALWFWGSEEVLCAGTIGDRAPWQSTTLLVLSFACAAGLVISTGNWNT